MLTGGKQNPKLKSKIIGSPINRDFSCRKRDIHIERKIILSLCKNRESSLSPRELYCSFQIKAQSRDFLLSPFDMVIRLSQQHFY